VFDFEIYVGPAFVLLVMLVAFIAFAVWGVRAIHESAEELAPTVDEPNSADELNEVDEVISEVHELDLSEECAIDSDLEKTNEFLQTASFAQSFMEGQEVDAEELADYNAAIVRIKADLDAADAAGAATEADLDAAADVVAALHGDDYGLADEVNDEEAFDEDNEALNNEALENEEFDNEATIMLSDDEKAAIRSEIAAVEAEENEEDMNLALGLEPVSETGEAADTAETDSEATTDIEKTIIHDDLAAAGAVAAGIVGAVGVGAAVSGVVEGEEILDSVALEETRVHTDIPAVQEPVTLDYSEAPAATGEMLPEAPLPFGSKIAWLAIPGYKPSEVIASLRLTDVEPANWTHGLTQAYADNDQVFVSPLLSGWVLVIGKSLWQKADMNRSAENIAWLKDIGRILGNACFYSTMRGLGNHGWVGIRDGSIVRAYGYSGELQELIWFYGDPTDEEIAINPAFANEYEERNQPDFRPVIPDEKMVLAMAAAWSVDVTFSKHKYPADFGFLGTLK
jgi:hypothetical protein